MADEDSFHDAVFAGLKEISDTWRAFETRVTAEITEYKKTVNSAIGLLADEQFQSARATSTRLDADEARRTARQRRTDRRDVAVLSAVGCLILINALAAGATIVAVVWLLSVRG